MKKIINIILFVLLSTPVFSQTELDMLVLKKINEYRVSNGLNKLQFLSVGFDAAEHHSNYLAEIEDVRHDEDNNETSSPKRRLSYYGSGYTGWVGENCLDIEDRDKSIEYKANHMVNLWSNSPKHNANMLNKNFKYGAVSCVNYSGVFSDGEKYKRTVVTFIGWN